VLQDTANRVQRHVAQAGVPAAGEQRLSPFHSEMWVCIPLPLSEKIGLGMKVTVLLCGLGHVLDDVLVHQQVVRHR
jgi:hypothetical protein